MADGINKVILIGNLGADPEMRYTSNGTAVCNFKLATSETYKDSQGNKQTRTEWHKVTMWAGLAEVGGQYLKKGQLLFIEGSIRTETWEKDGVKQYSTGIVAHTMKMLGKGNGGGASAANTPPAPDASMPEEEIPF